MSLMTRQKQVEKNKRFLFLGVSAGGLLATIAISPVLGIPIMSVGAYFGWLWFQYRAKNGMRF